MNNLPSPTVTELFNNCSYMVFETHVISTVIDNPYSEAELKRLLQNYKHIGTQLLDRSINPDLGEQVLMMITFYDAAEAKRFAETI
jgi:hypothetical protein